ncbi:DUF309 domain-containing protein [Massilibacterium senegalense]|uniref:DUF309 domain-containing protein n=1 Tax=Massilibacterium senegalense TaxID=1632858 RepID=UPI003898EEDF
MTYPLEYYQFFVAFHEEDYYTCHDLLEEIWLSDRENLFIKGLLQMSVALYHYGYGNIKGAREMMKTAKHYLQSYRPSYWGVNIEEVIVFIDECLHVIPKEIEMVSFEQVKKLPKLPFLELLLSDKGGEE